MCFVLIESPLVAEITELMFNTGPIVHMVVLWRPFHVQRWHPFFKYKIHMPFYVHLHASYIPVSLFYARGDC